MLTVKNGNTFDFSGRYDGIDYHFPKGSTVALPENAARHIFGIGEANKDDVLVRHGWKRSSADHDVAMDKLNRFSFDVADNLDPGEIITLDTKEQGSAPLLGEGAPLSDGSGASKLKPQGGSILEQLGG